MGPLKMQFHPLSVLNIMYNYVQRFFHGCLATVFRNPYPHFHYYFLYLRELIYRNFTLNLNPLFCNILFIL